MPRSLSDFKRMLTPVSIAAPQSPASSFDGMDRAIARKPRWRRYAIFAALAVLVGGVGQASPERKAAKHGHSSGPEDGRFREAGAVAVALEETGYAQTAGVVASETGVDALQLVKSFEQLLSKDWIAHRAGRHAFFAGSSGTLRCLCTHRFLWIRWNKYVFLSLFRYGLLLFPSSNFPQEHID